MSAVTGRSAVPASSRTPSPDSRCQTSSDCQAARSFTRRLTSGASTTTSPDSPSGPPVVRTPSAGAPRKLVMVSLVAISVFDGTQS